ncbi:hypothetical protein [Variovorax rhizosphaerae]|uniref:Uncharacterized protein n=1 Tax=Variovorax rhizosphaerae TaxID=1836200 RepID=A0ABU8WR99_9BURK
MTSLATFNNLGALAFLQRYPVTRLGSQANPTPAPLGAPLPRAYEKGNAATGRATVDSSLRLLHFDVAADATANAGVVSANCLAPCKISIGSSHGGGNPVYYLPYNNDEHHRITLTNKQALANDDFFLTALVDGCSIYVEGTAANPSVTHLNAVGTNAGAAGALTPDQKRRLDWLMKYAEMDRRFANDGTKPKRILAAAGLTPSRKLEAQDYMITPGSADEANFELSLPALQVAGKAPAQVGVLSVDAMRLMSTQGTVFGYRGGGGNWHFHVQRRALVEYFHQTMVPLPLPGATIGDKIRYFGRGGPPPRFGPAQAQINLQSLGRQWVIRDTPEFWPGVATGRAA